MPSTSNITRIPPKKPTFTGSSDRAFYRWISRDWRSLFPKLPERTRLFRLFRTHADWTDYFLADATVPGVADSYGIELLHPYRQGRSPKQMGKKGCSNHRWIVGGKLCWVLNQFGLITVWDCATANVYDTIFHPLICRFEGQMLVLADHGFFSKQGNPSNLKVCPRGSWNVRMIVAAFNLLVQWNGLKPDEHGYIHLSIAEFSI